MKIVSKCCQATLKWMSRKSKVLRPIMGFSGDIIGHERILGKRVRGYVCSKCGSIDR